MKIVAPSLPNYTMTNLENSIKVVIQARPQIDFLMVFVSSVVFFTWILLGIPLMSNLSAGTRMNKSSWLITDLPFYLFMFGIGVVMIGAIIFRLTLQETITISRESITADYQTLLFKKRSYQYLAKHIQGLRSSPLPSSNLFWSNRVAFDYGGKTLYMGNRLTESEAQEILSAVKEKFANYDLAKW